MQNIGVVRLSNNPVPGPRTQNLLREIAFEWKGVVDSVEEVGTIDSYKTSLELCRIGLTLGPSSGFNLKGLYNYIDRQIREDNLNQLKNDEGEVVTVFIACDTPFPYLNEYFEYLDEEYFPKIENENLLNNHVNNTRRNIKFMDVSKYEIDVPNAYQMIFKDDSSVVWTQADKGVILKINENIVVLDIRESEKFNHFHIPTADHIELGSLEKSIEEISDQLKGKKVITVCNRGNSSKIATSILRNYNIDAYSMIGGMTEWSKVNYPRWRPEVCRINYSH